MIIEFATLPLSLSLSLSLSLVPCDPLSFPRGDFSTRRWSSLYLSTNARTGSLVRVHSRSQVTRAPVHLLQRKHEFLVQFYWTVVDEILIIFVRTAESIESMTVALDCCNCECWLYTCDMYMCVVSDVLFSVFQTVAGGSQS